MPQIYIHIGPPKTGTTTIQNSLFLNRSKLATNSIYVPKTGTLRNNTGHHNLAWDSLGSKNFSKQYGSWQRLLKEIKKNKSSKTILSAEAFSSFDTEKIQQLRTLLREFEVYIVFYVRRQDKKIQSQWSERTKSPTLYKNCDEFSKWIEKNNYQYRNSDYYELYQRWKGVFGNNILIRVLEREQLQGTLFQDFIATIGGEEPQQYETAADMNVSPGIRTILLMQEYKNRLNGKIDRKLLQRLIIEVNNFCDLKEWNKQKWNFVTRDIYERIMSNYEESNRKLAMEYFNRDKLFLEPFDENITKFSKKDFSSDELIELNCHLLINFHFKKTAKDQLKNLLKKFFALTRIRHLVY